MRPIAHSPRNSIRLRERFLVSPTTPRSRPTIHSPVKRMRDRRFGLTAAATRRGSIFNQGRNSYGRRNTDRAVLTDPAGAREEKTTAGRSFIIERRRQVWNHRFLNTRRLARLRAACFIEVHSFPHSKATSFLAACEVNESFASSPKGER